MHWLPKRFEALSTKCGSFTAAVLIDNLIRSGIKKFPDILQVSDPPPTVRGIKISSAVLRTISMRISLSSYEAVISKKGESHPAPARRKPSHSQPDRQHPSSLTNWVPFTTLPLFTSRQGMIRFANMLNSLIQNPGARIQNGPCFFYSAFCLLPSAFFANTIASPKSRPPV